MSFLPKEWPSSILKWHYVSHYSHQKTAPKSHWSDGWNTCNFQPKYLMLQNHPLFFHISTSHSIKLAFHLWFFPSHSLPAYYWIPVKSEAVRCLSLLLLFNLCHVKQRQQERKKIRRCTQMWICDPKIRIFLEKCKRHSQTPQLKQGTESDSPVSQATA